MAGFQVRRQGFRTAGTAILAIMDDMMANGFTYVGPGTTYTRPTGSAEEKFSFTLEAGPNVDPLNAVDVVNKQPWRINFTVYDNATAGIIVGSDYALPNDGSLPFRMNELSKDGVNKVGGLHGVVGNRYTKMGETETSPDRYAFTAIEDVRPSKFTTQGFINRAARVWVGYNPDPSSSAKPVQPTDPKMDLSASFPFSYYLCVTPRGVFISVWEGAASDVDGSHFSWVLVQRPVDRDSGATIVNGKAPVFCVSAVGNRVNRFVVRESDILKATDPVLATEDTTDNSAIINGSVQVAVSEDNQYVVSFPSRLNTPRYAYTYELDMIGYTSATVVSQNTEIPLTLYGEAAPRQYVAVHSNMPNSNGMRIVALLNGGGIPTA